MPEPDKAPSLNESLSPRINKLLDLVVAALIFCGIMGILFSLRPLADVPMNDDFSWARTAEVFARTGKIVYNGWGNPILLPHTIAGAIVIRLFGYSHIVLGAFGIVSGAAFASACYLLARACSIPRSIALFFVALLTLNPVFFGVTPTFMSDIPSAFLFVASLLAFLYALEKKEGDAVFHLRPFPLAIAALFAFLAGANRQILWPALLLAFAVAWPAIAPADRMRRLVPALLAIVFGGAVLSLWFSKQPYSVPLDCGMLWFYIKHAQDLAIFYPYKFYNMIGLFLLPVALPATIIILNSAKNSATENRPALMSLFKMLAIGVSPLLLLLVCPNSARELWNGHWGLTPYGQYATYQGVEVGGVHGYGARPSVMSVEGALFLYCLGGIGIGLTLFALEFRSLLSSLKSSLSFTTVAVNILLVSSFAQMILPLPWYGSGSVFDRYLPALLPGLLIGLWAKGGEQRQAFRPYFWGLPLVLLYAIAGVAFSTEYFAYTQARASLYHGLLAKGVRPENIDAGVENCGDTQIALEGYINNQGIKNPPDASHPERLGNCTYTPSSFPAMDAQYLLSTDSTPPDLSQVQTRDPLIAEPDPVTSASYSSPIGPKQRTIYVYRLHKVGEAP